MDYSLAALKVTCEQLKHARQDSSSSAMTLGGVLFQRAWLQGILVSEPAEGHFLLDDGTGIIQLYLSNEFRLLDWKIGMYVMAIGAYVIRTADSPMIKVHKMVDLSGFPDREAMWHLEIIEAYKLFYQFSFEE